MIEPSSRLSYLVRVGAGICRSQLLQLQLIGALRDNTFAGFNSRHDSELIAIGVADDDVAALELFTSAKDVDYLFALVVENRFLWHEQDIGFLSCTKPKVGLHPD